MENTTTNTVEETYELASSFVKKVIKPGQIICLTGDLGSGKTTFT
ncbi:MAG: tRNA (adenosine(37)-N6)-threonylcarbamoyltransferase complex ATPase subunit type 1 TsaE, partial [Patescibacteria group bacterium]